jgi:hypothetical protein
MPVEPQAGAQANLATGSALKGRPLGRGPARGVADGRQPLHMDSVAGAPAHLPPSNGPRVHDPAGATAEVDRSYGIEYVALCLLIAALVFYFSERARKLLSFLYEPTVILLLIVVFAEYLILKARDRSYVLEREVELQRRKRREMGEALVECRRALEDVLPAFDAERPAPPTDAKLARARDLLEKLKRE